MENSPKITIGRKTYFIDSNLNRLREVDNPKKYIDFKNKSSMIDYIILKTGKEIDLVRDVEEMEIDESSLQYFDEKMKLLCCYIKVVIIYWKYAGIEVEMAVDRELELKGGELAKEKANNIVKVMTDEEKLMLKTDYPRIVKLLETLVKDWKDDDIKWIEEDFLPF